MDVDGTLTDGKIYMSNNGELFKAFDIKDGYAIANILPKLNIIPMIITGRNSDIVKKRCEELNIKALFQSVDNKDILLLTYCKDNFIDMQQVMYVGDDLNDIKCMEMCGYCACPADAVKEVRNICNFVSTKNGGNGAVREIIDWISNQ